MAQPDRQDEHASTQRIDGRLHSVQPVFDEAGNLLTTVTKALKVEFRLEDVAQLVVGAAVMALPTALTEEVWNLGRELSVGRTIAIFLVSILTLAAFVWSLFYGGQMKEYRASFAVRVASAYLVTFIVSLTFLWLFDKAPLDDLRVTVTRTILVALPASYAATAVDFVK